MTESRDVSTPRLLADPPWATGAIVALNVGFFVVAGPVEDYRLDPEVQRNLPSVSQLVADVLRHGGVISLVIVVGFVGPVGFRLEQLIGGAGVAATYLVGGFFGSFLEVAGSSEDVAVVGATVGTSTLLAAWANTRRRGQGTALVAPAVVIMVWFWACAVLAPGRTPMAGMAIAIGVGLYATKSAKSVMSR